jgi:hypothetical protein
MDPTQALREFYAACQRAGAAKHSDDENEELWEAVANARNLFDWLRKGGFAPDWSATE